MAAISNTTSSTEGNLLHHAAALETHAETHLFTDAALNARLSATLASSAAASLPAITISPLQGQFLKLQCQLLNARHVLEVGALGGYSTVWLASSGAHVTSVEIDPARRDVAMANTRGLNVDVVLGAALDVLPRLAAEGRVFDFSFVDASWGEQWECFDWAVKMTRPGGVVFVDNVIRELIEDGEEKGAIGKGETLVTKVGKDERVEATMIGTINSSKIASELYDGFLLAVVKGEKK